MKKKKYDLKERMRLEMLAIDLREVGYWIMYY